MTYTHGIPPQRCAHHPTRTTDPRYVPHRVYNMCPEKFAKETNERANPETVLAVRKAYKALMEGGAHCTEAYERVARDFGIAETTVKNYLYSKRYEAIG